MHVEAREPNQWCLFASQSSTNPLSYQKPTPPCMMTDVSNDETILMFFNDDFNPTSFVDALFLSIAGPTDRYSPQSLSETNAKTQNLLTHLDYNTNVLLRQLEAKMEQLKALHSPIGLSEYVLLEESSGSTDADISRLQYYVDSLKNAVETLSMDVDKVRREAVQPIPDAQEVGHGDPIESLISLKEAKSSILKVYHVIQNAQRKVSGGANLAVSDEEFQSALQLLYESLKIRLREGGAEDKAEIAESVKELRSWVPMFQPFTKFGPIYVKFVAKMENEL
ncbi:hypothetical protein METSCH_B03280 [Metschnikowia aff. pulcherrima]|uniref:Uncharacterized protein n=1 Tax=Metschnikowia aff. pulcherrima TaxID=2163413 RepID=A0A4P6XK96_9ASCO|nr:hypothetical protein METSCH_B03280 [Metschnikowia aff. pulcherrima]